MDKPSSSFNQSEVLWVHPEDNDCNFTVGDMLKADAIENAIRAFLSEIEDGKEPNIEALFEKCDEWGVSPCPCPICGRCSQHYHDL